MASTTTKTIGTWATLGGGSHASLYDDTAASLHCTDSTDGTIPEMIAHVTGAHRAAINAALPSGVILCGDDFYAPESFTDIDAVRDAVRAVDFWSVVAGIL